MMYKILELILDYASIVFWPFLFGSLFLTYLAIRRRSWLWMLVAMLLSGVANFLAMFTVGILFILQGIGLVVLLAYSLWRTLRKQIVRFRSGR
jgi:hypothetical protein